MSDPTDKHVGFFIVPAEHLDELHALEAAVAEAERCEDDPQQLEWIFYRMNQLFERAKEVATISTVIENSKYKDAFLALGSWFLRRFRDGDEREVLDPDELAAIARELPSIRAEDMLRWLRKPRRVLRKHEPLVIELFEALVRTVSAAPAEPSGFVMLLFYEKYRHPPEPPPPAPEPEPEPPDLDEGAIIGWFAVPAEHLAELEGIVTERRAAFRQGRLADFYALENRLFERARAGARTSAVFNAWQYREANRAWWEALEAGFRTPLPPTIVEPVRSGTWASWLARQKLEDVLESVRRHAPSLSEADTARASELFNALRRVLTSKRAKGCGLVIAWHLEKAPTWPRYDDASMRGARDRINELKDQIDEAEARLRAIATRQRRARARAQRAAEARAQPSAKARSERAPSRAERADIDRAADELASRFPWLSRLPDSQDIITTFAQQIAQAREARDAAKDKAKEKDAASALPVRVPIALAELFAESFMDGETGVERAGRQAMADEIARHPAWLELCLPRRGKPDVRVYMDGRRLRLQEGRLHADAFFARGGGTLLDVQAAWHKAVSQEGRREIAALDNMHPHLWGLRVTAAFREYTAMEFEKRMARLEKREERRERSRRG